MTDTAAIREIIERSFAQLGYIIVIISDALSSAMSRPSSATRGTTALTFGLLCSMRAR